MKPLFWNSIVDLCAENFKSCVHTGLFLIPFATIAKDKVHKTNKARWNSIVDLYAMIPRFVVLTGLFLIPFAGFAGILFII